MRGATSRKNYNVSFLHEYRKRTSRYHKSHSLSVLTKGRRRPQLLRSGCKKRVLTFSLKKLKKAWFFLSVIVVVASWNMFWLWTLIYTWFRRIFLAYCMHNLHQSWVVFEHRNAPHFFLSPYKHERFFPRRLATLEPSVKGVNIFFPSNLSHSI